MIVGHSFQMEDREARASNTFSHGHLDARHVVVFDVRSGDSANTISDPPIMPDRPPPPPSLVTHTPTSEPNEPTALSDIQDGGSSDMGMTILSIAVGGVAAFIIIPALAVVAYLYIRRWRNSGNKTYDSLDDETHDDDDEDYFSNAQNHHYHDEIQLKDYENESKPSFEETGDLATPASAIHVIPADFGPYSPGMKKTMALGSGTIRSPGV
ncbi:hypothetical protein G7054_g6377 [Neopestalotiopsis clavispora]|nr:hypothetical protein G7054_g6377 [Neopestalotiopsis clavispora]